MLELKIINGPREGSKLELHSKEQAQNLMPYLLEDEAVIISLKSDIEYVQVSLVLHENIVECTQCEYDSKNNYWIYSWLPKRLGSRLHESFFYNYFGIAELYLQLLTSEQSKYIELEKLDVLAKKINAERVEQMLSFLSKHNNEALCAFFRVTRRNAGYKDGDTPADIFLEWIEQNTNILFKLIDDILAEPIKKLISTYRIITPTLSSNIDDRTLGWLCDNIEELFETEDETSAVIHFNGDYFGSTKIRENILVNDTDVYENQVIHGFVHTLKISVSSLLAGYGSESVLKDSRIEMKGYISFFSQIKKFQKEINQRKIMKCNEILFLLNRIQNRIQKVIPVKRRVVGLPTLTMKAKYNRSYLAMFNKIISWYRFGSPDWSKQEELLSIKSIPKLFEYYCLFYLKENLDVNFKTQPILEADEGKLDFTYQTIGAEISLQYEPKYWMPKNRNSDMAELVNTEGWTLYNDKLRIRNHHKIFSHRSPDFVIRVKKGNKISHYILDAKYTTPNKAFSHYLPELTLKYIHGLHLKSGKSTLLGLTLIVPHEDSKVNHFHGDEFNINSSTPVIPALNIALIAPGCEFSGNKDFEMVIGRVIKLLTKDLFDDGLTLKLA